MDVAELFETVKERNASRLYRRADLELRRQVHFMEWGYSPAYELTLPTARRLRQTLVCQYDFAAQLDPPLLTEHDTVAQHRERDPEGCTYALQAIVRAVDGIRIPLQKILEGDRDLCTPEELSALSPATRLEMAKGYEEVGLPWPPRSSDRQ